MADRGTRFTKRHLLRSDPGRRGAWSVLILLLLLAAPVAHAFVPGTAGLWAGSAAGLVTKWDLAALPDGRIPYWINLNRPPGATPVGPNASLDRIAQCIQNAFQTWENIPATRARFRYMGLTSATNGFDGMNVVTFAPEEIQFNPGRPFAASPWIAPVPGSWITRAGTTVSARFPGQIVDCDIVINPQFAGVYTVSDDGAPQAAESRDLQGILVHEIGHLLGLDHTNAGLDAVMNLNVAPRGGFTFRNLSTDEVIGISVLYPREGFLESRGIIAGSVRRPDGRGVFGAHVVAVDAQTGVIVTSTISGVSEVASDGTVQRLTVGASSYRLAGLAPGTYQIYAEPLDGPEFGGALSYVLGGIFWASDFTRQVMETDFAPAFFAGTVTVGAQEVAGSVDITVGTRLPTAPNLAVYTHVWEQTFWNSPAIVQRGASPIVAIPPGANLLTSTGFVPGTRFEYHGPGARISSPMARSTDLLLFLLIATDAPFGPRLLSATTPDGVAFMSGGLIIVPPPPVIRSLTIETSATGTTVIIDGENFVGTSLPIVHFNGRMASDLVVENSTRLRATVPLGVVAPVEVRVITLGGIARG